MFTILGLFIILAALFIVIGWGVHKKKWYFLISGYNTMSKKEKAEVEIEPLAKSLALMSYILAVLMLLLGLCVHFNYWTFATIVTITLIIVPFIFIFQSRKYYKKGLFGGVVGSRSKKVSFIITIVSLLFVGILFYFSLQPTKIEVTDGGLSISGVYGDDYTYDKIENVTLLDTLPEIAVRTNGSSIGSIRKGHFKFKNGNKATLFIDTRIPSYIEFHVDGKTIILNEESKEATQQLFERLKSKAQ